MTPEQYFDTLIFGLQMALVGMVVVFVALVAITLLVNYFDRVDHWIHRTKPEAVPVVEEVPPALAEPVGDGLAPEIIAAVSVAVNEAITKKVVIRRIRYRRQPASAAWQVQGRATIMARHRE